ncbi:MAG: hypothetical protein AB7S77_00145 [Desulfatirhabdiaceae bacterium]
MQTKNQGMFQMDRAMRKEVLDLIDERIEQAQVFRTDIVQMKTMMHEIIGIQKHTDARMDRLSETMQSLTEAQNRTEISIKELADAQNRTDARMERLSETMQSLADAQNRTDASLKKLADAQNRTDASLKKLADAQNRTEITVANLVKKVDNLGTEMGGLSSSVGYAMENEAYRKLPMHLKERYGIEIRDRMIRLLLDGDEINFFAHAKKDGEDVVVVGEAELKFSSVGKMKNLKNHVSVVQKHYSQPIVPMIITHLAMPAALAAAKKKGVIVIQSFEW